MVPAVSTLYSRRWRISLLSVTVLATMLLGVGQPPPQVAPEHQEITAPQPLPATTQKDSWDKAFAPETWPNWFLAFVGLGGVVVAVCTLKRIASQARIMRHQTVLLRHQTRANIQAANEAKRNTQVITDKERARLSVEVGRLGIGHPNDPPNASAVDYTVWCHGTTHAEIVRAGIGINLHKSGDSWAEDHTNEMNLPAVLMPGANQRQVFLSGVAGTDTQTRFNKGELHAHLKGWVIYKDIFGSIWTYDFEYFKTYETHWIGSGKETAYVDEDEENSGPSAAQTATPDKPIIVVVEQRKP